MPARPQRTKSSRFCRRLLPQPTLARIAVNKQRIDVCCTVACSTFRTWRAPQRPMEEANLVSIPQLPHTQNITSFYSFRHFTVLLLLLLILLLLLLSKICGRSSFCICHRYGHPVVLYILPLLLPLFGTNGTTFYSLNVTLVEVFFFCCLCSMCVCTSRSATTKSIFMTRDEYPDYSMLTICARLAYNSVKMRWNSTENLNILSNGMFAEPMQMARMRRSQCIFCSIRTHRANSEHPSTYTTWDVYKQCVYENVT